MSIFTTLLGTTLLAAGSGIAPTTADDIVFNRTYKEGEKDVYAVHFASDAFKITADAVVSQQVLSIDKDGVPKIKVSATSYSTTGETTPSKAPAPLETTLKKLNMPTDMHLEGTNFLFLFHFVAGIVPNSKISPGSEIPISWVSSDNSAGVKGSMKVTGIKLTEKLIETTSTLAMSYQGTDIADFQVSSVYGLDTGVVDHCTGTLTTRGLVAVYTFKVTKSKEQNRALTSRSKS